MVKIYSKACEHVLRIISQIQKEDCERPFLAKDICQKAKVPEFSARKGLQVLVQEGILKAVSGPGGGYEFSDHPRQISLMKVVDAIDGEASFKQCMMGLAKCSGKKPCSMHSFWTDTRERIISEFRQMSVFDLMKKRYK